MTSIKYISGGAALRRLLEDYSDATQRQLDERNINATGRLRASHRVSVITDGSTTRGALYGLSYWTKAGSGSPPRTVADLDGLKEWLLAKGIVKGADDPTRIAGLIQDKIYLFGSRDFRNKKPNVYREEAKAVPDKVPAVLQAFLRDFHQPMQAAFTASFKVA